MFNNLNSIGSFNIKDSNFMLDTNILYWVFYGNASYSSSYQKNYQTHIKNLANPSNRNNLYTSSIAIAELFHIVEKNEFKIYKAINKYEIPIKQFRNIDTERKKIKSLFILLLKQIKQIVKCLDNTHNIDMWVEYTDSFDAHRLGCIDFSIAKCCCANNINNIISDDGDFYDFEGLSVYSLR